MLKRTLNLIIAISYYIVSLTSFNIANAQSVSKVDPWQAEYDHTNLSIMINESDKPDDEVKKQLAWGQAFALFGAFSFYICNNIQAYDVEVWAAAAVYFTAANLIIRKDERKIAELQVENHKKEEAILALLSSDEKLARSSQVTSLEEILKVQREAIKLIKRQNQLLKNMRTIYYSSLALLATLLVMAKTNLMGLSLDTLKCKNSTQSNLSKMIDKVVKSIMDAYGTLELIKSGFNSFKSITYLKIYPESMELRIASSELQKLFRESNNERSYLEHILSNLMDQFIPSIYAQKVNISMGSKEIISEETVESWVDKAKDTVRNTVLNPYTRLGLYGVMGTVTQFGVSRNNKDIVTYENKINHFDKQVQDLKANISKGIVQAGKSEEKKQEKVIIPDRVYDETLNSCVKGLDSNAFEFDELCECRKNKTCINLSKYVPETANEDVKRVFNNLDKLYNGDSSLIYDDEKAEALYQAATRAAETSMGELNKFLLSSNEKPVNLKENINKILKSNFYNPKEKPAIVFRNSQTGLSKKEISDLELDKPVIKEDRSGIFFNKDLMTDGKLKDINPVVEDSVFEIISLRYKKTALPILLESSTPKP